MPFVVVRSFGVLDEMFFEHSMARVRQVMELMELTPLRNAMTGLPGVNGLSVEQRKRLTIAVELVANPSIIFMVGGATLCPTSSQLLHFCTASALARLEKRCLMNEERGSPSVCPCLQVAFAYLFVSIWWKGLQVRAWLSGRDLTICTS